MPRALAVVLTACLVATGVLVSAVPAWAQCAT